MSDEPNDINEPPSQGFHQKRVAVDADILQRHCLGTIKMVLALLRSAEIDPRQFYDSHRSDAIRITRDMLALVGVDEQKLAELYHPVPLATNDPTLRLIAGVLTPSGVKPSKRRQI